MQYRQLGRTGYNVSTISFGAWAIGGSWGTTEDQESLAALHQALDCGVNFFDTADVYGDGRSERLLAELKRARPQAEIIIATKAGRRLPKQETAGYTRENLTAWIERSLQNLATDALDLVQLHCPPTDLYYHPEIFGYLDELVTQGKIRHYGVSVERVEEALKASEYSGVKTVQIIFNMFRQRPADVFFPRALEKNIGILARLPLSSGMLTGKLTAATQFAAEDHRNFNRHGAAFDVGETFSGIDYEKQLAVVEELKALVPADTTLAQFALRWIQMHPAVTCSIPGAKRPAQVVDNCAAADLSALSEATMQAVQTLYDEKIKALVHQQW